MKRKIFWAVAALILIFDLAIHFWGQWQILQRATTKPDTLRSILFLTWNTLAGSIEFFTSILGFLVIVILITGFILTGKLWQSPGPSSGN